MTPNPSNSPKPTSSPSSRCTTCPCRYQECRVWKENQKGSIALRSMLLKNVYSFFVGDNSERLYMTLIFFKSLPIKLASFMLETQQFHKFLGDILIVLVRSFWKDSATKALGERSGRYKWPFSSCFTGQ